MESPMPIINKLMVDVFNDILTIEENAIKKYSFNDVTVTEVHTVEAVGMYEQHTMGEIAKKLNITVGTLTVAISNLSKKNYVERFKCEDDRRVVKIGLTKKGRLLYRVHQMFHKKVASESIVGLSTEEAKALTSALEKLHSFLFENYINNIKGDDNE